MPKKKATKAAKKAPKKGGPKANPIIEDDWKPEWETEGLTDYESEEFERLLARIVARLVWLAKRENWPSDRLEDELGSVKQELEDELEGWAHQTSKETGLSVSSMNDWMHGGGMAQLGKLVEGLSEEGGDSPKTQEGAARPKKKKAKTKS